MLDLNQVLLLFLEIALCRVGISSRRSAERFTRIRGTAATPNVVCVVVGCASFLGCIAVGVRLHEPHPRINDEFSYLLMADTLSSGRTSNPAPPLTEFFDTFHVLMWPTYASKYFPAQGLFLATGEKLTSYPAVGVWLGSALASAAICWMLSTCISLTWGLLGGFLMAAQFGVFSYWSQSYWGGMVAALGGALFFGGVRRLWDRVSWRDSLWAALGIVILVNSRPLEGVIAAAPVTSLLLLRILRKKEWKDNSFWRDFVLPVGIVLALGAAATGSYNRAITGSFWTPSYVLHERQYQESPQFVFMPQRPKVTYSSPWIQELYEVNEMRLYLSQRTPLNVMLTAARKMMGWWAFYCGILLSAPLLLAAWIRGGRLRYFQIAVLAGFIAVAIFYVQRSIPPRIAIDILAIAQFVILWFVFDEFWPRLALGTIGFLLFEQFFVKYSFPHYFAPAACLVLYLQVESMKRLWHWRGDRTTSEAKLSRADRRRAARALAKSPPVPFPLRSFVMLLPFACLLSLILRVEARANGWSFDYHPPDIDALPMQDWSLRRAELQKWLEQQPGQQLVFVRYFATHDVNHEWVWNRADIAHAKVVWARDFGSEHNQRLLRQMPDRKIWHLLADLPDPRLVPYDQVLAHAPGGVLPPPDPPAFLPQAEP